MGKIITNDDVINMTYQRMMWLRNRIKKSEWGNLKIGYKYKKNIDLQWVDIHLKEILEGVLIGKGIMLRANDLWRKYDETRNIR